MREDPQTYGDCRLEYFHQPHCEGRSFQQTEKVRICRLDRSKAPGLTCRKLNRLEMSSGGQNGHCLPIAEQRVSSVRLTCKKPWRPPMLIVGD